MTCPDCKAQMVAVEYRMTPEDYDGTSEYACACGVRIGRWNSMNTFSVTRSHCASGISSRSESWIGPRSGVRPK